MTRVYVKHNFFLGLFCSLRQLELSLDRFDIWEKLLEYFSKRTPIISVMDALEALLEKNNESLKSRNTFAIRDTFLNKWLQYALSHFGRKPYLYSEEIWHIHYLFAAVLQLFRKREKPEQKCLNELRIKLRFCYEGFRFRLHESSIKKGNSIEHYNQNDILQCLPLEEIVGKDWLLVKQI